MHSTFGQCSRRLSRLRLHYRSRRVIRTLTSTCSRSVHSTAPIVEPSAPQPVVPGLSQRQPSATLSPVFPASRTSEIIEKSPQPPHSSLKTLLPLLRSQPPHYITIHLHARPYLVTQGDTLRLPFLMPQVQPGDLLRLTRASHIGSREFTLKGAPYIDGRLFECRARVLGVESEPMRFIKKTKRRQRKVKTVKSKHRYTILRIAELKVKELDGDGEIGSGEEIVAADG